MTEEAGLGGQPVVGWDGLARLAPGKAGHFHGSIDQLLDIGFPGEGVWLWMK